MADAILLPCFPDTGITLASRLSSFGLCRVSPTDFGDDENDYGENADTIDDLI